MHLENGRSTGNNAYAWKGANSSAMVASRPKVTFLQDDSTSPGNYEWLFVDYKHKQILYVSFC
jgi:hypothetical protein